MTTIAYLANEFPSLLEPYVMDEIRELRSRGVAVVCCSGKRVRPNGLGAEERKFCDETHYLHPIVDSELVRAVGRLASDRRTSLRVLKPVLVELPKNPIRRIRSLGHVLLGAVLAERLQAAGVGHIHAHHGYFASWIALVAARILGIDFSFTLHGSDVLLHRDLLAAKLAACRFCVTVSDYNRDFILRQYASTPPWKVLVQRLGVDRAAPVCESPQVNHPRRFCLLAVGRLHPVKNYPFLIQGCAALREQGMDLLCWIAGDGPERTRLERLIAACGLQDRVLLLGQVPRRDLTSYFRHADLVVLTSHSEGLPVVLMEAMAHARLVLAPSITGIPELIAHRRNGFLYVPGSLTDFVGMARWILDHHALLQDVGRTAAETIAASYDRQRNVSHFADEFLRRIAQPEPVYAHSLLQQVQLPV